MRRGVLTFLTTEGHDVVSLALKASDRQEYGDIDNADDRKSFASISPINNVARIRAPLPVEHGAKSGMSGTAP